MIQTLYNGLSGVKTHQFGVDTWSNNIANVNTVAYRADIPLFETVFSEAMSTVNANSPVSNTKSFGVTASSSNFDVSIGTFKNADNINSLALSDDGWFVVGDKAGNEYYTRDGNFTKDSEGYLVNQDGMYVLGYDLGKVENNVFKSDLSEDQIDTDLALKDLDGVLSPIQIIDDTFFQPTATTSVDTRVNLNKEQNIKSIDEAFRASVYNGDIDQIAQRDLGQFYDIKDGTELSIKLTDDEGNVLVDANGNPQEAILTYMSGLDAADRENRMFSTIAQLQDVINLDADNDSIEFVLSIEDGNFQFKNISGEQFVMDFSNSSPELLEAFALPENIRMTSLGDTVRTAPLYQKNFYEQDMNTLHNDTMANIEVKTNDDFSVRVNGSLVKEKILYTHDLDNENNVANGMFNSVGEFIAGVENLLRDPDDGSLRVRVYMQDCRIKLENITNERIEIDFSSANLEFIKSLGLSSEIILDPDEATQTSKMHVPTYSTSNEIYDIAGKKYFLNTSYVLKSKQELGIGEDVWDMYSMIYSLENDSLVSDNYTLGQLRFQDVNLTPTMYAVDIDGATGEKVYTEKIRSTKDDIFEYLEVDFNLNLKERETDDATIEIIPNTVLFNPTGTDEGISTAASYMDSTIRDSDIDGNPEGYLNTMVVDMNGVINYYFSNEKAEAFGRVGVVNFVNAQGLEKVSGNLFQASSNTGERNFLWDENTGSLKGTTVLQNKLETSNVDMNQALTELIVMQRGYASSAKSISTADEMLQKAIELKR
jgi:flagellar hook protein FlgE